MTDTQMDAYLRAKIADQYDTIHSMKLRIEELTEKNSALLRMLEDAREKKPQHPVAFELEQHRPLEPIDRIVEVVTEIRDLMRGLK